VTFLTAPEPRTLLVDFYRKTHPSVFGWEPIAQQAPDVKGGGATFADLACWIAGCVLIYGFLLGIGKLLLGDYALGAGLLVLGIAAGAFMYRDLSRRGWASITE
jgi:hypothetical protein